MTDRFTDSQMLKLAETYRDYESLWNVRSTLYRNRDARQSAYKEISEKLNFPGISPKDIPRKIKNLRSSYCQELKRIEKSIRSGAGPGSVYKPKVSWFSTADGLFRAFRQIKRETFFNIDKNTNTPSDNETETQNTESGEDSNTEENLDTTDEHVEDNKESKIIKRNRRRTFSPRFIIPLEKPVKKLDDRAMNTENVDIYDAIDKIDHLAKRITNSTNSLTENKQDEFDIFGKYIATTLRSLPGELAIIAKTDVQKALAEIQLRALRQNTKPTLLLYGSTTSNTYDPQNT